MILKFDCNFVSRTCLSELETLIRKRAEEAYVDPEKAEAEKAEGNALFKAGDFSGAVKKYSEAIRYVNHRCS